MGIDIKTFQREGMEIVRGIEEGGKLGRRGDYYGSLQHFRDAQISAGVLLERDSKIGKMLGMDKLILLAKTYQLKAYLEMFEGESDEAQRKKIINEMGKIARGDITRENPYCNEILQALEQYSSLGYRGFLRLEEHSE
jgi:hypothetical protein